MIALERLTGLRNASEKKARCFTAHFGAPDALRKNRRSGGRKNFCRMWSVPLRTEKTRTIFAREGLLPDTQPGSSETARERPGNCRLRLLRKGLHACCR